MNILSKSNQKKFAGIILTSVLTFTYGTSVFAATTSNKSLETKYNVKIDYSKVTEALKVKLNNLVDAGMLTQTQADAVLKAMSQKGAVDPQEQKGSPLDSLVKAETLTEDQANSIEDIYKTIIDSIINSSN